MIEVWLHKPNLGPPANWLPHWTGILIAAGQAVDDGLDEWAGYVHAELYFRYRDSVVSAEVEGVRILDPIEDIENYTADGSTITAFDLVPPYDDFADDTAWQWAQDVADKGTPYDWAYIIEEGVFDLAKAIGVVLPNPISKLLGFLPHVDIMGLNAFACAKLVGAFGNKFLGWDVNLAHFNPSDFAGLVKAGRLRRKGPVTTTDHVLTGAAG